GFSGDGGTATAAELASPRGISVGPGGVVYIADTNNNRVRMVDTSGQISTIAGGGPSSAQDGDGGAATQARLSQPADVVAASWGDVFIADTNHNRIRRVMPDGKIHAYAGTGNPGFSGDDGIALSADLNHPQGVELDSDGNVLVADTRNHRVRLVRIDGSITTAVGGGTDAALGDFGPATGARLKLPSELALSARGEIYIADTGNDRIRRVTSDGYITSAAQPSSAVIPYRGAATAPAGVLRPAGLAVSPSGAVLVADTNNNRIVNFATVSGGFDVTNIAVPSSDGSEIYEFSPRGQHLKTADAKTGATLLTFEYDGGLLKKIVDGDGNETTIEHEDGNPSAIVGPYGQRVELGVDSAGRLTSVTNPSSATYGITYAAGDLLETFTKPNGATSTMTYDAKGRLASDENAAGGSYSLEREDTEDGHNVDVETALGRKTAFEMENTPDGFKRTITDPAGNTSVTQSEQDGSTESTQPDGSTVTTEGQADPRLRLKSPYTSKATIELPSGRSATATTNKRADLADPDDPFSLLTETRSSSFNGKSSTVEYNRTSPVGSGYQLNQQTARVTATSPTGRESEVRTDAFGRPLVVSEPGVEDTSIIYDANGRPTSVNAGARSSAFAYDSRSNLQSVTDPLGRVTSFEHDAAGRATAVNLPGGRRVEMTYDVNGNLTSVSPPTRPAHPFNYNLIDLLIGNSAPEVGGSTRATTFDYDADQALTKATRPSGDEVDLNYDAAGRLSEVTSPDGANDFEYNAGTGQLDSATSDDAQQAQFEFDGPLTERIEASGAANGAIAFSYDNDLRTSAITTPGGATALTYDDDSLLTQAGAMALTRSPASGQLTATSLASTTSTRAYNTFG
ncbi:MAG: hypothetical protein ACPGWS_06870, partial [Solirubrobacterales bacterium]